MKRLAWALIIGTVAITACGDDDAGPTDTADTTDTAETTDTAPPDETDTAPPDDGDDPEIADDTSEPADTNDDGVSDAPDASDDATDIADGDTTADTVEPPALGPCDPIDPSHCPFPFPSNLYLVEDAARATGHTLDFGDALPENSRGKPVDSAPYRRLDGYGVGTPLLVSFPDLDKSGLATEYDTDPSLAEDAPILWFEVAPDGTLSRLPYFVDDDVLEPDPARRVLIVRPAAIMKEATRYVVAFRGLRDNAGALYPPSPAFAALRDGTTGDDPALAPRQARFDALFADLAGAGVDTAELQLAWDFNTASCDALHGPLQHMIAESLETIGEDGATLVDVEVEVLEHETWALEIRGFFEVPHYMKPTPMYGDPQANVWVFNEGPDGLPAQDGVARAPFWVRVPKSAIPAEGEAAIPHGIIMYGHGQNGSGTQLRGGFLGRIANEHHYVAFSTDMWGMSEEDVAGIIDMLVDLSGFPRMADRLHQGLLNHVVLARTMREQLPALAPITERGIVLDPTRLYYTGISQGGIYGASIVAVSPDMQRGHLGVPGNNYGYLLMRSRNFDPFFLILSGTYSERWEQLTVVSAIMQLWEGADPVSYMRHLSAAPFPNQGENAVLFTPAKGDVQVAVTANEWIARSGLGVAVMTPYDRERPAPTGVETATYPRTGSGIVLYDFGNPWPPESENAPPTSDAPDPHGLPRQQAHHNRQLAHFLETGEIIDVCSDDGEPGCTPE